MATMVSMNTGMLNGKDSRWLQLEVCREFQRNKCTRPDTECKFSHPAANVEIQNGRVTACYDSIKGRCNREKPPCKYFHPPLHLKEQLLINGRNHLALKNALMQQIGIAPGHAMLPGQVSAVVTTPYITGIPTSTYSPYFAPGHLVPTIMGPDPSGGHTVIPQGMPVAQQKIPRSEVTNNMTCYYAHSYTHYQLQPRNETTCHPVTAQQPPTHTIVPYVQVQQPKDRIVHYIRASDQMVPSIPQPFRAHCG